GDGRRRRSGQRVAQGGGSGRGRGGLRRILGGGQADDEQGGQRGRGDAVGQDSGFHRVRDSGGPDIPGRTEHGNIAGAATRRKSDSLLANDLRHAQAEAGDKRGKFSQRSDRHGSHPQPPQATLGDGHI